MASSMVRAVCWKCDKCFPSMRERKNHMANREHSCLRVLCPFCTKEKFMRRSSPELLDHCTKAHTKQMESLPKGFFSEGNGFWLSRHPRDYVQLVDPTSKSSLQAVKAREIIREKFRGTKELESWEVGWKLAGERKRAREPSLESESSFKPDYDCLMYSPSRPAVGNTTFTLGQLQTGDEGIQALLISEDESLFYRVLLSKSLCTMERDIASLFRRLRPHVSAAEPETWRTTTLSPSLSATLSKSLGVHSSLIKSVQQSTKVILEPISKKSKTSEEELNCPELNPSADTSPAETQTMEPSPVESLPVEAPPVEQSQSLGNISVVTSQPHKDEHHTPYNSPHTPEVTAGAHNFPQELQTQDRDVNQSLINEASFQEVGQEDICLENRLDDVEEPDNHSAPQELPESVKSLPFTSPQQKPTVPIDISIQTLLSRGAMPLFPPARRNWARSIELPISGDDKLTWPPEGWTNFTADQKLLAWEFAAMRFASPSNIRMPLSRGDLLDRYNFLALPGTQVPPIDIPERKARYYVYETLRKGPSSPMFFQQIQAAATLRDTSVDHILDVLDFHKVPVRL